MSIEAENFFDKFNKTIKTLENKENLLDKAIYRKNNINIIINAENLNVFFLRLGIRQGCLTILITPYTECPDIK